MDHEAKEKLLKMEPGDVFSPEEIQEAAVQPQAPQSPVVHYYQSEGKQMIFNSVRTLAFNMHFSMEYLTPDEKMALAGELTKMAGLLLEDEDGQATAS